jgi:hypothetical protein
MELGLLMAMNGTVQVPGIGPVKKTTALAGGAVVTGLVVIMYVRSRSTKNDAASVVDPNAINPVTGYPFGSPQDTAALAALNAGSPPVIGSGGGDGVPDAPDIGSGGLPVFGSNAAWSQYAENYMTQNQNADAATVGNALGKYITGGSLSQPQSDIVNSAIAIAGYPPVHGPAGFPPSMHIQASAPTPPKPVTAYKYVVENHNTGAHPIGGRQFIINLSVAGAPVDKIEVALRATMTDPRNVKVRQYFAAHGGYLPASATVAAHIVKKA